MSRSYEQIIILALFLLFLKVGYEVRLTEVPNPNHLCDKVTKGDFDRMRLQSISPYRTSYIVFLESDYKYYTYPSTGSKKSYSIEIKAQATGDSFQAWDAHNFVNIPNECIKDYDKFRHIKAIYTFKYNEHNEDEYMLFVGQRNEYLIDMSKKSKDCAVQEGMHKQFSIINNWLLKGFVISEDIFTPSSDYVMYELMYRWDTKYQVHFDEHEAQKQKDLIAYYFMELTDNPNEVLFVSKANRAQDQEDHQPSARFLQKQPVGYLFEGQMYLFDSKFGCVYIIDNMVDYAEFNTSADGYIRRRRENVPFEDFFKCPDLYHKSTKQWNKARCNRTREDANPVVAGNGETHIQGHMFSEPWHYFLVVGIGTVLVLLLALGVIICKSRNSSKQTASSASSASFSKGSFSHSSSWFSGSTTNNGSNTRQSIASSTNSNASSVSMADDRKNKKNKKKLDSDSTSSNAVDEWTRGVQASELWSKSALPRSDKKKNKGKHTPKKDLTEAFSDMYSSAKKPKNLSRKSPAGTKLTGAMYNSPGFNKKRTTPRAGHSKKRTPR